MLQATYTLPYRSADPTLDPDLVAYLGWLCGQVDQVVVVDGSEPIVFAAHAGALPPGVEHLPPTRPTSMGKVGGVVTGVAVARHERVVIGDDDVRCTAADLERLCERLDHADVVRPANAFEPLVWHARLDTSRTLLNRLWGGDWPGTLAVRRSTLLAAGGYRGDVLFENLELVRTVQAVGGTASLAQDVLIHRRPPTTRHYLGQRVRQAYDELARPWRLAWQLALAPATLLLAARGRWRALACLAVGSMVAAEAGRRRDGGRAALPATSSLLTPLWLAERAVCSWVALGARLRGGARYAGGRLRVAASSPRQLRRDLAQVRAGRAATGGPAPTSATAGQVAS